MSTGTSTARCALATFTLILVAGCGSEPPPQPGPEVTSTTAEAAPHSSDIETPAPSEDSASTSPDAPVSVAPDSQVTQSGGASASSSPGHEAPHGSPGIPDPPAPVPSIDAPAQSAPGRSTQATPRETAPSSGDARGPREQTKPRPRPSSAPSWSAPPSPSPDGEETTPSGSVASPLRIPLPVDELMGRPLPSSRSQLQAVIREVCGGAPCIGVTVVDESGLPPIDPEECLRVQRVVGIVRPSEGAPFVDAVRGGTIVLLVTHEPDLCGEDPAREGGTSSGPVSPAVP